ncbi:response regulator [Anabaena sp. CA = ATCC 33047]|uniref:response regulator n=1 Tax=Anabaena sp. (strain CA / ATCC 33047) TaxID=52271 RepID=UPI000835F262|nr:response regulator [Anabaena sp. CA = ATCC 33047]
MQGNLREIDLRSILQLIELGQRTGQLLIESDFHSFHPGAKEDTEGDNHSWHCKRQAWFIFFLNGQIIYCQEGHNKLSRIDEYLRQYRGEISLEPQQMNALGEHNSSEYGYIWMLLEKNMLNPTKASHLIYRLVCETLFDLLSLQQGRFIFHQDTALAPQLTTWEISALICKISQQLQEWKQLSPYIQSPEQLLILADTVHLYSSLPATTVNKLKHWADGKTTLRQLSRYLDRDILTVAKTIYPYVQQGWLKLTYPPTTHPQIANPAVTGQNRQQVKILCIDDTQTICDTVKSILQAQGYQTIALTNPLEALSQIFQFQPHLVLCNIAMPELDGYEICAMLRQSQAFRHIPMIMLTSKDKFIDRVRAKMVGATDLLTKPLREAELLMLVEKYLNA